MWDDPRNEIAAYQKTDSRLIQQTKRQRLEYLKKEFEMRLKNVNDAIQALDDNPNVEEVINKIDAAL